MEWISIDEKPKQGQEILIAVKFEKNSDFCYYKTWFFDGKFHHNCTIDINTTHWLRIRPPKN